MSRNVRIKIKKIIITPHNESLGRLCSNQRCPVHPVFHFNDGTLPDQNRLYETSHLHFDKMVYSSMIQENFFV